MNLDNFEKFGRIDRSNMMEVVLDFPREIAEAVEIGSRLDIPTEYKRFSRILIAGMGGSAIPGDFLKALLWDELPVPLVVNRGYTTPRFVDGDTLVFAISYSGDTEETLAAFRGAREAGAKLITVTSGGQLLQLSKELGIPCLRVPGGRQTRASFGYLSFPLLTALQRMGVIGDKTKDVEETIQVVEKMRRELAPSVATAQNAAKALALKLSGKFALIFGTHAHTDVVALRWKQQLNENSKAPARYEVFPELNHNEIVAWDSPWFMPAQTEAVFLRDERESSRIQKRIEVTREFLGSRGVSLTEVWSQGNSSLARLISLSYFSNFVSLYLALLDDVDPTPVEPIAYFKRKLAS